MTATRPAPSAEKEAPAARTALRYLHRVPAAARNLWIGGVLLASASCSPSARRTS